MFPDAPIVGLKLAVRKGRGVSHAHNALSYVYNIIIIINYILIYTRTLAATPTPLASWPTLGAL